MRVLFVKDESSMLRGLDAKTKLSVMLVTAVLVVACSGVISQMVLFLFTLVYVLMLKRPKLVTLLYILMAVMMAVS
ncbi:MAG: energy-coupling factor transporter transmembrane protein EcfT, partial [Sutterella wadsworthensis]